MNTAWNGGVANDPPEIPPSEERSCATEIIDQMQTQSWYKGQISFRQETEEKAARQGLSSYRNPLVLAPYDQTKGLLECHCR